MKTWQHTVLEEKDLKEIVRNVYDCKTFTSLQCGHMVMSVFMPALFLGAAPSKPSFPTPIGEIRKDRKNKLLHLKDLEQWRIDLKQWEDETPQREKYLEEIGMLYEDHSKAGPTSINGYPIFMSCKLLSKDDTKRFLDIYRKYEKMREEFEKEF